MQRNEIQKPLTNVKNKHGKKNVSQNRIYEYEICLLAQVTNQTLSSNYCF